MRFVVVGMTGHFAAAKPAAKPTKAIADKSTVPNAGGADTAPEMVSVAEARSEGLKTDRHFDYNKGYFG